MMAAAEAKPEISAPSKTLAPPSFWIIGHHYGGTSMVAAIIETFEIDLGECAGPNATHPLGNKEDLEFLGWALRACGGDDSDPEEIVGLQVYNELKHLVRQRDRSGRPWGVKLPLMTFYAPLGMSEAADPRLVIVQRGLRSTSRSYAAKEGVELPEAEDIWWRWQHATHDTHAFARQHGMPVCRIWYEDLLGDQQAAELERLAEFCGGTDLDAARAVILPDERHF